MGVTWWEEKGKEEKSEVAAGLARARSKDLPTRANLMRARWKFNLASVPSQRPCNNILLL